MVSRSLAPKHRDNDDFGSGEAVRDTYRFQISWHICSKLLVTISVVKWWQNQEDLEKKYCCDANSSSYEFWVHTLAICGVHLDMGLDVNGTV